ncbi:hypothetical protein QOT17_000732 [Balamuthia mandrillaris]
MTLQIDARNKEAFLELQEKLVKSNKDLNEVVQKVVINDRNKRKCRLTLEEIVNLPGGTRTYKSVGRAFLLAPREDIQKEMETYIQQCDDNVANLQKKKGYLESQIQQYEKGIEELIIKE